MPKTGNQKENIIGAALTLFAEQGYASTAVSDIARAAGVSQGLLYNFFPSKAALLQELIRRGTEDILQSMVSYAAVEDPRTAMALHIRATVEIVQKKRKFWKLLHAIRLQGAVLSTAEDQYATIVLQVTRTFTGIFKKLRYPDPQLEAMLFLAQIDGLVILYLQNEKTPLKKLAQQLIKRYAK